MSGNEKFMFDTIFDELEPIVPEIAEDELGIEEELLEAEPEEEIVPTFSEEEVTAARQEGFAKGKEEGVSETLAGIEKSTSNTLTIIADRISTLFTGQDQANKEITDDAVALSVAIVRKFFPTLNEKTALDEVMLTVDQLLGRLIDEPRILIKANPAIIEGLTEKLTLLVEGKGLTKNLTVVADEDVNLGDCKIEWSNGTSERNLATLMRDIDDIIAQNSTNAMESLTTTEELEIPAPEDSSAEELDNVKNSVESLENGSEIPDSDAAFEQNVNDAELELGDSDSEKIIDDEEQNEPIIESNEKSNGAVANEDDDTL